MASSNRRIPEHQTTTTRPTRVDAPDTENWTMVHYMLPFPELEDYLLPRLTFGRTDSEIIGKIFEIVASFNKRKLTDACDPIGAYYSVYKLASEIGHAGILHIISPENVNKLYEKIQKQTHTTTSTASTTTPSSHATSSTAHTERKTIQPTVRELHNRRSELKTEAEIKQYSEILYNGALQNLDNVKLIFTTRLCKGLVEEQIYNIYYTHRTNSNFINFVIFPRENQLQPTVLLATLSQEKINRSRMVNVLYSCQTNPSFREHFLETLKKPHSNKGLFSPPRDDQFSFHCLKQKIGRDLAGDFGVLKEGKINPYERLEIKKDANDDDIKKAFRQKAVKEHPDKVPESEREIATEKFKQLEQCRNILLNAKARQIMDEYLSIRSTEPSPSPSPNQR